jgi:hypothetical protein
MVCAAKFLAEHPTDDFKVISREESQMMLTTYYEVLGKIVGASGQEATLHCCSSQPRPVQLSPALVDIVPPPAVPAGGPSPSLAALR